MEYDKTRYVAPGVPLLIDKELITKLAVQDKFTHPRERDNTSFRVENPFAGLVLDQREAEARSGLARKIEKYSPDDLVELIKKEGKMGATLLHMALVYGAQNGAQLSPISGLPILTSEMGRWVATAYRTMRARYGSDRMINDFKQEQRVLYDVVCISNDLLLSKLENGIDFKDPAKVGDVIERIRDNGAERSYRVLAGRNEVYRSEAQLD